MDARGQRLEARRPETSGSSMNDLTSEQSERQSGHGSPSTRRHTSVPSPGSHVASAHSRVKVARVLLRTNALSPRARTKVTQRR